MLFLIMAFFSNKCIIRNISFSDDVSATISCLKSIGAYVEMGNDYVIIGGLNREKILSSDLFCNESASTLRFLIPLCLLSGKEFTFYGTKRLFERHISYYSDIFSGRDIVINENESSIKVNGKLSHGKYYVKGDVSSQYISGLLMALSLTDGESEVNITGDFESRQYVKLTVKVLKMFGADIVHINERCYRICGKISFENREINIGTDYSNTSYFEALNYLGGKVNVVELETDENLPDKVYFDYFKKINDGCPTLDVKDCPDLAPILIVLAALKNGARLVGTKRLKFKESDRANVMKTELVKLGIDIEIKENEIIIPKCEVLKPEDELCGHNDHRIVMALSVILTAVGGKINGAEAVKKSFPDFFSILSSLGIIIGEEE